jgi:hypothetical protein
MELDAYGNEIIVDMTSDDPEGVEAWNLVANICISHGLGYLIDETGAPVDAAAHDELGRILWHVSKIERQRPLTELTLADVNGAPRDLADEILAKLPATASKRARAKALVRSGMLTADIIARLRVSDSTVSTARAELISEHDRAVGRGERPEPLHPNVLNPGGASRRGQPRPDMKIGSGTSPFEKRAADLGVSVAEARLMASDKGRIKKYGERPEDLKRAASERDRRARKQAERGDE